MQNWGHPTTKKIIRDLHGSVYVGIFTAQRALIAACGGGFIAFGDDDDTETKIEDLMLGLDLDWGKFLDDLQKDYGTRRVDYLTASQAEDVLSQLQIRHDEKHKAALKRLDKYRREHPEFGNTTP